MHTFPSWLEWGMVLGIIGLALGWWGWRLWCWWSGKRCSSAGCGTCRQQVHGHLVPDPHVSASSVPSQNSPESDSSHKVHAL